MAKEVKQKRKKVIENVIKTDCDEKTVKGVADAFLLAVDDIHDERDIERCCPRFLNMFSGRATQNSMDGERAVPSRSPSASQKPLRVAALANTSGQRKRVPATERKLQTPAWQMPKYECTHLRGFETLPELHAGLEKFMNWYNNDRIHSSLSYFKPSDVYFGRNLLVGSVSNEGRGKVF